MVEPTTPSPHPSEADIVVVSDLHMGRGHNPETGRFHNLEAFFYDDDFLSFCRYLCRDAQNRGHGLILVLNGDILDFLRVEPEPSAAGASLKERMYGAPNTPETAPRVVRQILAGHPGFVRGLATILDAGHTVVWLSGNHDIETQWAPVRIEVAAAILEELAGTRNAEELAAVRARLVFLSWFYWVPGRIWIEHGCQYDPANAFSYLLRGKLTDIAEAVYAAEHDMPLGNFFQRYLYNAFGHITFIVPDARANLRYVRWFLLNEPRFLARVLWSHLPFAAQMLRRITKSAEPGREQLAHAHAQALARIARSTGLGDKLRAIDALKEAKADAVQAMRSLRKQLSRSAMAVSLAMLIAVSLWFVGFLAINDLQAGIGLRALLFITLNVAMVGGAAATMMWKLLRGTPPWRGRPLVRAAGRIADILDVPIVTFGHTHVENITRLERPGGEPAWYVNTGTWIAVFRHDELVPRERVQYTFLRVRGRQPELLHWSPGRGEPLAVILVDDPPLGPPGGF
jgi:UDP-2,3-diacylglucosamine pyrophosphatase LpxH